MTKFLSIIATSFVLLLHSSKSVHAQLGSGQQPAKLQDLELVFQSVSAFLLPMAGVLFFALFVIGGFKYLTSGGDLNSVASAHKTLTYALGGLIVVALAYLVLVIVNYMTGADILNFTIYRPI